MPHSAQPWPRARRAPPFSWSRRLRNLSVAATRSSPRAGSASRTRASKISGETSCPTSPRRRRVPPYTDNQFYDDLMRVTEGRSDIDMAEFLVKRSRPTIVWMKGQGIRWILMFARQSYQVEGKHHFWGGLNVEAVGGGAGLVEMLLERAAKVG